MLNIYIAGISILCFYGDGVIKYVRYHKNILMVLQLL